MKAEGEVDEHKVFLRQDVVKVVKPCGVMYMETQTLTSTCCSPSSSC